MNGIRGPAPALTPELREYVLTVSKRRRELAKQIATLRDEYRALPSKVALARQLECCEETIRFAASGHEYAHERVAL